MRWALRTEIGKRLKVVAGALRRTDAGATTEAAGDAGPSTAELEGPVLERIVAACKEQGATRS